MSGKNAFATRIGPYRLILTTVLNCPNVTSSVSPCILIPALLITPHRPATEGSNSYGKNKQFKVRYRAWFVRLYGEIIPEIIIDRTGAQTMLYLTCTTISSVEFAHYGVSLAKVVVVVVLLFYVHGKHLR